MTRIRAAIALASLALASFSAARGQTSPDFETQIRPIFDSHCLRCHGSEKNKGGLRLDLRESAFTGGDSKKPAIVPNDVEKSRLFQLISAAPDAEVRMPPKGEMLKPEDIALIRAWIESGAHWPGDKDPVQQAAHEMVVSESDRAHWAFKPLSTSSDALKRLQGELQIDPASKRQLIRRASFGLLGLPPAPQEIDAFEADARPDSYERMIDRLLASKHYGERWARHWLDLVRYADSDGYESDKDRPNAWPYRDWLIRALNDDMPYDQFVRWQLAGDEYVPNNPDAVVATGFLTAGPIADTTPADTEENKLKIRYDELDDIVSTTGSALLGLTIGCARCHDHKYDPIPARDYYRLLSAFKTSQRANTFVSKPHREREHWVAARHRELREAKMANLGLTDEEKFWLRQPEHFFVPVQVALYKKYGAKLRSSDQELREWLPDQARQIWTALDGAVQRAEHAAPGATNTALIAFDHQDTPEESFLLARGSVTDRSTPVSFGVLQVLQRGRSASDYLKLARHEITATPEVGPDGFVVPRTTYQRKALAEWITDVETGAGNLLARVIVNRLWQHHFGEGLVSTPNDFGTQGAEPFDPELLDALAAELVRQGWRLKPIHRLILLSPAYRAEKRKPVRLEAEALRDSILAVSGRLNRKMFGPPFRPVIPKEAIATRSKDEYPANLQDGVERWRRSVYGFTKRSVSNPFMEAFDAPDYTTSCGRRNRTTVPTQALILMNDELVRQSAIQFAQRVMNEAGDEVESQIRRAYALALGRPPKPQELERAHAFVQSAADTHGPGIPVEGLTDFCHTLFTLNEFIYVD